MLIFVLVLKFFNEACEIYNEIKNPHKTDSAIAW